jgi:RNA polymerase sigma-70 factor (ECF subfamily)
MDLGDAGLVARGVAGNPAAIDLERVAAAKRGDLAAFNRLVLAYQELAYNVALRLVGNADLAADVAQEAFLSAYRHLDQFKDGSFRSWLLRIVTNGSYDAIRSRNRHPDASLDDLVDEGAFEVPDPGPLPEKLALRREQIEGINAAIQTLPLDQRAVLVLYDVHGLSYDEISATLALNLGTVKSRLNRARGRLRDYLMQHPELWRA